MRRSHWAGATALFLLACGGTTANDAGSASGGAAGTSGGTAGTGSAGLGGAAGMGAAASGGAAGLGVAGAGGADPGGCGTKSYFSNAWALTELDSGTTPFRFQSRALIRGSGAESVYIINGTESSLWWHAADESWRLEETGLVDFEPHDVAIGDNSGRFMVSASGLIAHSDVGKGPWTTLGGATVPAGSMWLWDPTAFDYPHLFVVGSAGKIARWESNTWSLDAVTAADLNDISGSAPDDVFAVGAAGTVLHYGVHEAGGSPSWKLVPNPSTEDLKAVWSLGAGHAVAVGANSTVLDLTPDAAQSMPTPSSTGLTFTGVWAASPQDVFVTGGIALEHWDGSSWETLMALESRLQSVWGSSSRDVYVLLNSMQVMHCSLDR